MIIVSDTTPLHYLILIDHADLLSDIFGEVIIPEAVIQELSHERTPLKVKEWIKNLPHWIKIKPAKQDLAETISGLGKGETEAISIAIAEMADAILMDDKKAIREAKARNLTVITILGILELASAKNLIDLSEMLNRLRNTTFRLPSEEILIEIVKRDQDRKSITD